MVSRDRRPLGSIGSTRIYIEQTDTPWASGVDSLVVSVGPNGTGELGRALMRAHPELNLRALDLAQVAVKAPVVVNVPVRRSTSEEELTPQRFILVTLHTSPRQPTPDEALQAIPLAVAGALRVAVESGSRQLGLSLLGGGAIGVPSKDAANALAQALHSALAIANGPEEIVLLAHIERESVAIVSALSSTTTREPGIATESTAVGAAMAPTDMSGSAWDLLRRAAVINEIADDDSLLLAALAEVTPTGVAFVRWFGDRAAGLATAARSSAVLFSGSDDDLFAIPGISRLVTRAVSVARQTSGSPVVHARHLLGAAVTGQLSSDALSLLKTDDEELRRACADVVQQVVPSEWGPGWRELLDSTPSGPLSGGVVADLVRTDAGLPATDDHLGVSGYVAMIAKVIARADTPLPLSIGLFGEWGSGKSTFMALLRGKVDELAKHGGADYHRDIKQVAFNAWSYADTNLWASLGDEIFRSLLGPGATDGELQRDVRQELTTSLGRAEELTAARDRAEQQAAALQSQVHQARTQYVDSLSALAHATAGAALDRAWSALQVTDVGAQGRILANEVRGVDQESRTLRHLVRHPRSIVVAGWLIASLMVASVGLTLPALRGWLTGAGVLSAVGAITALTTMAQQTRTALAALARTAADLRTRVDRQADDEMALQVAAVQQAETRQKIAQSQLAEVLARAGELQRQLVELEPGHRLYSFLHERAASRDYRDQLGLISTIRNDFERLRDVLAAWRATHHEVDDRGIDRIVLYIDDLDRCSPRQVVEVLQAVHLLLALDLFVVVVGVDPRWLLHSLRQEYREVLTGDRSDRPGGADLEEAWLSTPSDYVEKIFNVPFVVPSMTKQTFGSLVRALAQRGNPTPVPASNGLSVGVSDSTAVPDPSTSTPPPQLSSNGPGDSASAPATAMAEPAATPTNEVKSRPVTESELVLLSALSPLVASPRQTKRLVNIYRMLRSSEDLGDASSWLGDAERPGQHQAVAVLLGLLTYDARLVRDVLFGPGGICTSSPAATSWTEMVAMRVAADPLAWTPAARLLSEANTHVHLTDLTAFQRWGPHVARFSFLLAADSATGGSQRNRGEPCDQSV